MLNEIITGIGKAIDNEFNTNSNQYEIYAENVEQGLREPCFIVIPLLSTNDKKLHSRYFRSYSFDVHFFPKDKINPKRECHEVAERLFLCLESVFFLDNTVRGIKMRDEIIDGVLHFFVSYEMFVKVEADKVEVMKDLTTNVEVKK